MAQTLPRKIIPALFVGLALLVGAVAALHLWREEQRGRQLSADAFAALQRGDRGEAMKKYTAALGCRMSAGDRALAYNARSAVYLAGHEIDCAIADLDAALRIMPNLGELHAARGAALLQKKDVERALADYSRAIELSPNYSPALLARGKIFLERQQPDAALADLNEAVRTDPNNAEALQDRGNAYLLKGDAKSALANFESVLRSLPPEKLLLRDAFKQKIAELADTIAGDLRERGVVSYRAREFEEAIRSYDEALGYHPSAVTASTILTNRANARRALGQREKAAQDYGEAIRLNPEATLAYYNRATNALEMEKFDAALADFGEVLRLRPSYAPALLGRGQLFVRQRDFEKANADFEAALQNIEEVNPAERLPAIERVAWMRATSPQAVLRNGAQEVELATALCLKTQWASSRSMDTLAAANAEAGRFGEAVKTETEALQLNDMPPDARRAMEQRLELYRQHKPFRYPEK